MWHGIVQVLQMAEKPSEGNSLLSRTKVEIADKAVAKALETALKDFHSLSHISISPTLGVQLLP